jgi:hypothetical protein
MTYTDEKPTAPGWYWVKDPSGEITVCEVTIFKDGPLIKHRDFIRVYDALIGHWQFAGPIPEPVGPCPHCAAGNPRVRGEDEEGVAYWHHLPPSADGHQRFCACANQRD